MRKTIKYLLAIFIVVVVLFLGFKKNIHWQGLHQYDTRHFTIYYEDLNQQTLKDIEQKTAEEMNEGYDDVTELFIEADAKLQIKLKKQRRTAKAIQNMKKSLYIKATSTSRKANVDP